MNIQSGDATTDNGNHFESRAAGIKSYSDARHAVRQILQIPKVAMSTHNIMAYRFTDKDNNNHEGTDENGEHGAAFTILKDLRQNNINNVIVVVSRKFGQKLGPRRFNHISNAAKSAVQKVV
ncbi:hypothetical protein KUTeg_008976 [Tegillarca granosa]|uniref:Impact N-terminal domain-containing protein n=1 Tax=Tegillarca granosa TaxID=220873 RepID=A0ABQ9F7Z4_TEGGR|nr:hypothetical protein KUTeg_008976 [Tegillarca granosa]